MRFNVNLEGRTKNFTLKPHQHNSHFPILEAIVNSIQAIAERKARYPEVRFDGKIEVKFTRESNLLKESESRETAPRIVKVEIIDNGVGFDLENMEAFMETDTDHKADIGGKGVGRLSWLKAFKSVSVNSVYIDEDKNQTRREFSFTEKTKEVDEKVTDAKGKEFKTSIILSDANDDFKKHFPVGLNVWADRILRHCLMYFFDKQNCPQIILQDEKDTFNLNREFNDKIADFQQQSELLIGDKKFILKHMQAKREILDKHLIVLFGNRRAVAEHDISKKLVDIAEVTLEGDNKYLCLVESKYLDENVDMNRLAFDLPETEQKQTDMFSTISIEQIVVEITKVIDAKLKAILEPIRAEKTNRIKSYIQHRAPRYGHLLRHKQDEMKNLINGTDEKIDEQLYRLERQFDDEERKKRKEIEKGLKDNTISKEEYKARFKECVERVTDANKSRLAEYVVHRKSIIELFEKGMQIGNDDKYSKENYMHGLIYPMRATSEEIDKDDQNLWLIDERLSYFFYASSDIPFNNNSKERRTDIMLFDKPISFVDEKNDGTAYDKVVVFELKKPMRDDLEYDRQNPVNQILAYKEKLETNTVRDKNGRLIKVDANTKFYLYVVCDILPKYASTLKSRHSLKETVDKLGYFRMDDNLYIEVLSYDKIINDAKKRNEILFEKLGIS